LIETLLTDFFSQKCNTIALRGPSNGFAADRGRMLMIGIPEALMRPMPVAAGIACGSE
jgi:hypothetical protein